MPPNTNLFTGVYKRLLLLHRAHSYIQTQHGERGNVGVVRERGRTADDRLIKAELHPLHLDRASGDHPSIHATASDLGFKELVTALTPVCIGIELCISVNAATRATVLVTRLKPRSHYVPWRRCN